MGPTTPTELIFQYTPDVSAERRTARATAAHLCRSMAHALTKAKPYTITIHTTTDPREAALQAASLYQLANQLDPTATPSTKWDKPKTRRTR